MVHGSCQAKKHCWPSLFVFGKWLVLLMEEIRRESQLRLVVYPVICKVSYIPGACLGFLPSTDCQVQNRTQLLNYE